MSCRLTSYRGRNGRDQGRERGAYDCAGQANVHPAPVCQPLSRPGSVVLRPGRHFEDCEEVKQQREPLVLLYQTDDGTARVEVRMEGETVWLSQNQMANLFKTTKQNDGQHICNVFAEGELATESVVKDFRRWQAVPHQALQPGRHHLRRLSRQIPPQHPDPPLGDAAVAQLSGQGICPGRNYRNRATARGTNFQHGYRDNSCCTITERHHPLLGVVP